LDTDEAMTSVLSAVNGRRVEPSGLRSPFSSFSAQIAKRIAFSVSPPQSRSGFCCECACLTAMRNGWAVLNALSAPPASEVKFDSLPAAAALARVPCCRFTVSVPRSCTPMPLPLSA
jgi:hypothetical protein